MDTHMFLDYYPSWWLVFLLQFFSQSGDTIVTKDSSFQDRIGRAPTMSYNDIRLLNSMYPCESKWDTALYQWIAVITELTDC